jgi:hypothetical protein
MLNREAANDSKEICVTSVLETCNWKKWGKSQWICLVGSVFSKFDQDILELQANLTPLIWLAWKASWNLQFMLQKIKIKCLILLLVLPPSPFPYPPPSPLLIFLLLVSDQNTHHITNSSLSLSLFTLAVPLLLFRIVASPNLGFASD